MKVCVSGDSPVARDTPYSPSCHNGFPTLPSAPPPTLPIHLLTVVTAFPTSPTTDRESPALKISSETPPPNTHFGSHFNAEAVSTAFAPFEAPDRAFQTGTNGARFDILSAVPALSIPAFHKSVPAT